jgi:hypothetical protein
VTEKKSPEEKRKSDPFLDRRNPDDRRQTYDIDYFSEGGRERREAEERRTPGERRKDCVKVSQWSSVCPKKESRTSE